MQHRHLTTIVIFFWLISGSSFAIAQSRLITFEDLAPTYNGYALSSPISNSYSSLNWVGFRSLDTSYGSWEGTGYINGVVSGRKLAYNAFGEPASISQSSVFDLDFAYLTSAYTPDLTVRVLGYLDSSLVYDNTYILSVTSPLFAAFNYKGINRVEFHPNQIFVVDNIGVTVPEPKPIMLLFLSGILIFVFIRKAEKNY